MHRFRFSPNLCISVIIQEKFSGKVFVLSKGSRLAETIAFGNLPGLNK